MRVAFFISGFSESQLRLQPWLTFLEVGLRMKAAGHDVVVVSDCAAGRKLPLPFQRFSSLRGTQTDEIVSWLRGFAPDRVVASVSPFSLATAGWHAALDPQAAWAFLPYALYTRREMTCAWSHLVPTDRWGYGRNLAIPRGIWRRRLSLRFRGVICQSRRTIDRLGGGIRGEKIPPGIDLERWSPLENDSRTSGDCGPFLFVGSPKSIRGFEVLLTAMRRLGAQHKLLILARGLEKEESAKLHSRIEAMGISDRVDVRGGWLSPVELISEIRKATAVVLPFVLVPSEIPVSVMEVIACGTPVIVTDIDGLPEAAGQAGIVVPPGDSISLAAAMSNLMEDRMRLQSLRAACRVQRSYYASWDTVARQWTDRLEEE